MKEHSPVLGSAGATDPGQRPYNEDAYLLEDDLGLYLVADGVGGRAAGDVAARLACDTIREQVGSGQTLTDAIIAAHESIRGIAERSSAARSMASTIVALRVHDDGYHLAWSGDSRGYLWDSQRLLGLTRDHSLVEAMVQRSEISREQAREHPRRNVIVAALGGESARPEISVNGGVLEAEGTFLLCSDGLTDILTYDRICHTLSEQGDLQQCVDRLTALAHDAGGRDNITVALIRCAVTGEAGAPATVFEIYDPASGNHRWPEDRPTASTAPTVRRVRGRSGEATVRGSPVTRNAPAPPRARRVAVGWKLATLAAAIGIAALGISHFFGSP